MDSGFTTDHVSSALQAILTRKAEDKRKALLDSISQQNADTNRMQAENEMEWRKAQAKREEAIANKERLNDMAEGQDLGDEDVSWLNAIGQSGAIKNTPTGEIDPYAVEADGSISEGPVQEMKRTYAGSPQERQNAKQTEALSKLIQQDPEFLKKPYLEQWLTLQSLGVKVDPTKLRDPNAEQVPLIVIGRDGKPQVAGQYPKNAKVVTQPAPRGVGAASETYDLVEDGDPTTPPMMFGRKSGTIQPVKTAGGATVPTKDVRKIGTTIPQPPKPVAEQWRQALPSVRKAVDARGKAKGLRSDQLAMLDANINAARATVINLYNDPNATPALKNQLVALLTNPTTANMPVDKLIKGLNKQRVEKLGLPPLTEEEAQVMRTLIPELQGR